MAIVVDIISEFSDSGLKTAKGAFDDFKTRVSKAEGAMGKFKAGSTAAMDIVKANASTFALGAGAALATFAGKAVTAFQDLALEADKFSTATGLAVEDASRWIEFSGDLGINADSIQTAIGKMNRELGQNPDLLRKLGDDVVYANDGTIDANETFLKLIDRVKGIKDPTDRAKEAAKLFGKGWQDISQIIDIGATDIRSSLEAVADTKVIDEKEVERAKKFRDSMDNLKDKFEELSITVGEGLVPILTTAVDLLSDIADFTKSGLGGINDGFKSTGDTVEQVFQDLGLANDDFETKLAELQYTIEHGNENIHDSFHDNVIGPINDSADALDEMKTSWDLLTADIQSDVALRDMEIQLGSIKDAAQKAFGGTKDDFLNYRNEIDQARIKLIELGQTLDLQDQRTLKIYVDKSDIEGAVGYLKGLNLLGTGFGGEKTNQFGRLIAGARATGGAVSAGGTYLVGERGPELLSIGTGGRVTPNSAMGGGGITVNVNGGDPNAIVRALQQYARQSGPVPINTRTM